VLRKFVKRVKGQGLVEYALILSLVALIVIVVLVLLGPAIGNIFSAVMYTFQYAPGSESSLPAPGGGPGSSGPPDCYSSLLLPIMVGLAGGTFALTYWLPQMPGWLRGQ
jgi:pilus assembly protein Flp/PilA